MEAFGKFCTVLILMFVGSIVSGFIFMKFWEWFVISTFDVQALTVVQALGLSFFLTYVTIKIKKKKEEDDTNFEELVGEFLRKMAYTAVLFGFGYIIHLFY